MYNNYKNYTKKQQNLKIKKTLRSLMVMRQAQIKFRPQLQIPNIKLSQLLQYPELQRRVNTQQYQLSGIHNLIVQLRKETIQQLKQEFINNNNTVNLHQFMWLISNSIMVAGGASTKTIDQQYYQYEIEYEIVKVFSEIDIDDSNSISWQEYIEYITSSSLMEINQTSQQQLSALTSQQKSTKQLTYCHREKTLFRKNLIRKIVQLPKLQLLAIVQKKSDVLTFLSINGNLPVKKFQLNGIDHNKVLSIDYCDEDRMFGVLMNTHTVIFVEDGQMQKVHGENKFSGDQIEIMYLKLHRLWLLVSIDNSIEIFTPEKGRNKQDEPIRTILRFKPHSDQLIGIRELLNPLSIVTASWNGSLKIWSLSLNQLLIQLNPCKQQDFSQCKSIKGFQVYNNQLMSYMICWLFSTQISVWLPSSSLSKPYFGKLKGHIGIVQQAKFLTSFPIVVSIDSKNSIRVWDITKMQCIQTWKIQRSINVKIQVLVSAPYVLLYDKLIQFYKSTKQVNLNQFKIQKLQSTPLVVDKNNINSKVKESKKKLKISQNSQIPEQEDDKTVSIFQKRKKQQQNQKATKNQNYDESDIQQIPDQTKTGEKLTVVLSMLYDDYLDCLAILTSQSLSLIAVNTGKLMNKIYTQSRNEKFLSMCLKVNRRIFLSNNYGEVNFIKTQDCSSLYKLYPFKDLLYNEKINQQKQQQPNQFQVRHKNQPNQRQKQKLKNQKVSKQSNKISKLHQEYQIFCIDYNSYNQVLLIVAQSETNSIIITYDSFSSFEASKKKQVIFDQKNLCSFASSKKYNMYFIASNRPQTITIWDYHNFVVIKSIQMKSHIINLSVQSEKYNLLMVTQITGIRVLRLLPIDARNNTRGTQMNIITNQLLIKTNKVIQRAEIMFGKIQIIRQKIKKNKVTFNDQNLEQTKKSIQQPSNYIINSHKLQVYLLCSSMITILSLQQIADQLPISMQPLHCARANITKQFKKINIVSQQCPQPILQLMASDITKQSIEGSRKGTIILGKVSDIVYFQSDLGVLYFYKSTSEKIFAKMSMPKCQIIQWQICYNIVTKIIQRLQRAESVSHQIYAYKRKKKQDENKIQYLRTCFFLNKYFKQDDMKDIRSYFQNLHKNNKKLKFSQKQQSHSSIKFESANNLFNKIEKKSQISNFNEKGQEKQKLRNQANEKLKEIERKYNKVFSYIRNKQSLVLQEGDIVGSQVKQKQVKNRSSSVNSLNSNKVNRKANSSTFKIRTTVSSVNKIFFEHSKQIKNCLNKIGIINNKIKNLKL